MDIEEKEFEKDGWFGKRGLGDVEGRAVVEEREYVRFGPDDLETVFRADDKLRTNSGFVRWLVQQSGGGFVMQKHPVPPLTQDTDGVMAQVRPDRAPVTEVTYHDHSGMEHTRGRGCACGVKRHRKAFIQRPYGRNERVAHEGGKAHTEPDPANLKDPPLPVSGPHRHTQEGKYMMSPNRDRQSRAHTHRVFLPPGFEPRADVLAALVGRRGSARRLADELNVPEETVDESRSLANHLRRPVDHRQGGHGLLPETLSDAPGLGESHDHVREVAYSLQPVLDDYPAHRGYATHGKRFKRGDGTRPHRQGFDPSCRKCVTERHVRAEHYPQGVPVRLPHGHVRTERVPLPSTEKRLDMHPRSRRRLEGGERPARVFFSIEGTPKNDSLVAQGEVAFNVPSVTMWRAPELEEFARDYLLGSVVFIVPDSDWASNPQVALQAFECREFLRAILGDLGAHVAAAPPRCGSVCEHTGAERKAHKNGVDDWLGSGRAVHDLLVLDRYPSDLFLGWETSYRGRHRSDRGETDVRVMEWLALHATENSVRDHPGAGHVKRSVTSIQGYLAANGRRLTEKAIYKAFDRLVAEGILETVPKGVDLKRITKIRRAGSRMLYLGEDWEGGVTFRIHPRARWQDVRTPVGQMMTELEEFAEAGELWKVPYRGPTAESSL